NLPNFNDPAEFGKYVGFTALDGIGAGSAGKMSRGLVSFGETVKNGWKSFYTYQNVPLSNAGIADDGLRVMDFSTDFAITAKKTRDVSFAASSLRFADDAAKGGLQYSDDLLKAAQQAYPKLAGKTQLHHITPKYLGGPANGPLIKLDAAYHQQITNAFWAEWGYGIGKPSAAQLDAIMNRVYSQFPLPKYLNRIHMKEVIEFRIGNEYVHLLLKLGEGKRNASNTIIHITKDDPKFEQIRILDKQIREKNNDFFFLYSNIKREYSKKEIDTATLFQMKIKTTFEPVGEECGTIYDETAACEICGANRKQISPLTLKKGSILKKDIARTIAGELVVSEKFTEVFKQRNLKGAILEPVIFGKGTSGYYQLVATSEIELSQRTVAGINIFDLSTSSEGEIYKCPKGHTIGLNLLSEAYVLNSPSISGSDFLVSKQKIGVKRGHLRPEPIYFCSQAFRKMVEEEKLSGFEFEITNIFYT
ncbi:hypothetical protein, partial [Aquiflexum sp.]|uniref:hypothetical protein n=1 Tax=Aquiflexum sp. TaxID=1872584 RepID=UPI0035935DC7